VSEKCKVTVQRIEHVTGCTFGMTIGIDGKDAFELANGGRATVTLPPGRHTVSGRLGFWPLKVSGEIAFSLEPGQHINLVANPAGGMLGHKLVFGKSDFDGEIEFG
jgi:hypothetical protein